DNLPAEVVTERHKKLQDESYLAFLDMLLLDRPRPKRVKARGTPLLILGGEQDRIFPAWETRRMAKAYDLDARLFPMPHNLMQERGWEDVADTMLAWLAQQGL